MRFVVWTGVEEWMTETAAVELTDGGLRATGTQLGAHPVPYRVDYRLECPEEYVTRELELTAQGDGWWRHLLLRHDGLGAWTAEFDFEGYAIAPWDGRLPELFDARDVDIENSPLTNTMPIRRHGFQDGGSGNLTMAFVRMPSLEVRASPQRYEHVRAGDGGSVVRYVGLDGDFSAELELDDDGLLAFYPHLARRVEPGLKAS
jgi:uncharacterized protein